MHYSSNVQSVFLIWLWWDIFLADKEIHFIKCFRFIFRNPALVLYNYKESYLAVNAKYFMLIMEKWTTMHYQKYHFLYVHHCFQIILI